MTNMYKGYCALLKERGEKRLENEKRAPRGQQVDFLTPEKAPAKIYGVLWWAELEVRADQSKDLYLRSYAGGSYSNGIWESLPGAVYGDIPPEVYEERTIQTLLRKLNVAVTGSGLRAWLRAAVR